MKKILLLLISIFMLISSSVFATSQYIEFSSGEKDDGSIYLNSYEEYLNAMKEVDDQELYKKEYMDMIAQAITSYDLTERTDVIKARVLKVESTKEHYSYDEAGVYKVVYQPITVQILEGKHKGETFDVSYILTADTYENLKIAPIKENQKINVVIYEEEGQAYAYATTIDAAVSRIGTIIILIIIAIVFMIIYLGKKALKAIPGILLLVDLIFLVFVPELFAGRSILWLTLVTSILYLIVDTTIKLGLNSKMVSAIFSSLIVTVASTLGLVLFGNIVNFSGITYEITNIIETFPKGTIDFYMLYLSSFILMSIIITSDISCKAITLYLEKSNQNAKNEIKDYVASKIPIIIGILLVMIIPKYLYVLITKYAVEEILNSEMLTTDIVRMMFLIIASTLTIQIAEYSKKLFVEEKTTTKNNNKK